MTETRGALVLILHAHLPFIRHPEHEFFLEEDWYFEALTETYIPLLHSWERLNAEGLPPRIGISFSPTLCAMMEDQLLQSRYRRYLTQRLELAEKEVGRLRSDPQYFQSAVMYRDRFKECLEYLNRNFNDMLGPFRRLQEAGAIEIVTCTATHGMLPLMIHPEAVYAQVAVAAQEYRRRFNRKPAGIWLGECAYAPQVSHALARAGFRFFFVDQHGLDFARPKPRHGVYALAQTPEGVGVFGRDMESAKQVWSSIEGYPGDPSYREFYRDLGYDGDLEYIRPYLHPDGVRRNLGIKYHRVTGHVDLNEKEPYNPEDALNTARIHAEHFLRAREEQSRRLTRDMGVTPVIVSTYDAELYGHWWFEGPAFLEEVVRQSYRPDSVIEMRTPSSVLQESTEMDIVQPEICSWGDKGYFEVWLNGENDWVYPHLHTIAGRMIHLAKRFTAEDHPSALEERALNQCAREVLLAQASDWPFMMTIGSHVEYAQGRIQAHVGNFLKLEAQLNNRAVDQEFLSGLESRHGLFPNIDFRMYVPTSVPAQPAIR